MVARMTREDGRARKLLTVSNRGPMEFHLAEDGELTAIPGSGGLATALRAAASITPMTWLSNPMTPGDRAIASGECDSAGAHAAAHFVLTDPREYELFYGAFSNEVLWLIQHDQPWPESLDAAARAESWHEGYIPVNQAFANAVVAEVDTGEYRAVMFHDYHFCLAPAMVREQRPSIYLQQFIHIPWPKAEVWERLEQPILQAICEGLLGNDSLVFQTPESSRNFLLTCRSNLPEAAINMRTGTIALNGRVTRVWADGISVDPEELAHEAASPDFARYRYLLKPEHGQQTIVRVDRLDPTKNVVTGFQAFEHLLETYPDMRGRVTFMAFLVPSKSAIDSYKRYQDEAIEYAEKINRRFGSVHWKPIQVSYENNRTRALAAMSMYDVLLVNPLADGMNLVAKEGPMLNDHGGVLVLSREAGAYAELASGCIGIEPTSYENTAAALYWALTMPPAERREMNVRLRQIIRKHDLRAWLEELLADIEENAPIAETSAA
jgi:trehalose 6-phosphate synthase